MEAVCPCTVLSELQLEDIPFTCLIDKTECNAIYACKIGEFLYCVKGADVTHAASLHREKSALTALAKVDGIAHLERTFFDDTNSKVYLIKRFICGTSVEKLFYCTPHLQPRLALHIVLQTALILSDIHANNFVYRDLKANNVVLNKRGEVFLIDMGHCTMLDPNASAPQYGAYHAQSPEVLYSKGDTAKVDSWSLGVLLFELLTGKPPFGYIDSIEEARDQVAWEGIPPVSVTSRLEEVFEEKGGQVVDLFKKLLVAEEEERITPAEVVAHQVFSNYDLFAKRGGFPLSETILDEIEMQSLGKDEEVAPPTSW